MGLRCLIGHDYGPPETEREREDRGGEEVVTIREFKECRRCGERQVISENKEVRPNEQASPGSSSGGESTAATEADPGGFAAPPEDDYEDVSAEDDDGVILSDEEDDGPEERQHGEWPDEDDGEEAETDEPGEWPETEESGSDTESEASESEPEREWPEAEPPDDSGANEGDEPGEWPDVEGEDEGYDAVAGGEASADDVEFGGGLTPERSGDSGAEGETVEAAGGGDSPTGIASAEPGPSPTGPQRPEAGVEAVLVCPRCDTVVDDGASLRPGDICPECRSGYLAEREE